MRSKFVWGLIASSLLVVGVLFLLRQRLAPQPPLQTFSAINRFEEPAALEVANDPPRTNQPHTQLELGVKTNKTQQTQEDSPEAIHELYVQSRINELLDLGMNDDAASLDTILRELTNRDPQIRKAALEAAVQFGSRDAIPKLTEAALQTDKPEEKVEIAEAIKFLNLPSPAELAAKRGTAR